MKSTNRNPAAAVAAGKRKKHNFEKNQQMQTPQDSYNLGRKWKHWITSCSLFLPFFGLVSLNLICSDPEATPQKTPKAYQEELSSRLAASGRRTPRSDEQSESMITSKKKLITSPMGNYVNLSQVKRS